MSKTRTTLRLAVSLAAILAAGTTGGCFPLFKSEKEVARYENRFPVGVDADTASMAVPVEASGRLSAQAEGDLRAFIAVYKARGHGPLTVARPAGAANEKTAQRAADGIMRVAASSGVNPMDLMPSTYRAPGADPAAPVVVSFTRFVASAKPCGDWSHNAGESTRNNEMPDFGCATANNFAAAVEDPHDLIAPRTMTPANAERRATVYTKYKKGETTITDRKDSEQSDVSKSSASQ